MSLMRISAEKIYKIIIILALLACVGLGYYGHSWISPCNVEVERVVERDTIFRNEILDFVTIPKPRLIRDDLRLYHDTIAIGGISLAYSHEVKGFLNNSSYSIRYPQITNTTISNYRKKNYMRLDLLVGVQVNDAASNDLLVGLGMNVNRFRYSYSYGLLNQTHNVNLGFRIFER